jgi:AbrB family looped-hinge helix DNA binding protein
VWEYGLKTWRFAVLHTSGNEHKVYRSRIDKSGRIVLPAEVRSTLGVAEGDSVLVVQDGKSVEILTPQEALRQAQEYFMKLAPPEVCMSDELIRERREEAAHERE